MPDLVEDRPALVEGRLNRADRHECLDTALALVRGDDRWSSYDVLEFADYLRTGEHPQVPHLAPLSEAM